MVAPQVQKAYGQQPPTTEGVLEGYYLGFLAIFFIVILAEGLFIALSVRELADLSIVQCPVQFNAQQELAWPLY